MPFRFKPQSILEVLAELREKRKYPDPQRDRKKFVARWTRNGKMLPTKSYRYGELARQKAMVARLERDLARARAGLDAVANEARTYLTVYALVLTATSVAAAGKLDGFWQSPYRFLIWGFVAILILLLRSHASRLSSWVDNYEGAGAVAGRSISQFAYADSLRQDILRYNARLQRSARTLALVHALFVLYIIAGCVFVTLR